MNEIKIRSDNRVSVGANIKRIRISKGVRAFDLIRDLQLQGFTLNKQRYYKLEHDLANIYASEMVSISQYLNVDINEFFRDNQF